MDHSRKTFIVKLPANNTSDFYVLHSFWDTEEIKLEIVDFSKCEKNEWTAIVPKQELKTAAAELEIPFESFYGECKLALCTNGGLDSFNYNINANKFTWKKIGEFDEIYGSVELQSSKNLCNKLLFSAIDLTDNISNDFDVLVLDHQKQDMEYKMLVESYEKCVSHKNTIEKELLRKFSVLLNAKKEKIAELQELLLEKETKFSQDASKKTSDSPVGSSFDDFEVDFMQTQSTSKRKMLPKRKKLIEEEEEKRQKIAEKSTREIDTFVDQNDDETPDSLNSQDMFNAM